MAGCVLSGTEGSDDKATYTAVYRATTEGAWQGEVAELEITTLAVPTLEDAREALNNSTSKHLQCVLHEGGSLPVGVPRDVRTVADRMEVTVFKTGRGERRIVTARSEPSYVVRRSPYLDKDGNHLLLSSVVLVIDELGATSKMVNGLTEEAISSRARLLSRAREWLGESSSEEFESVAVYTDNLVHGAPFADAEEATSRLGFSIAAASHYQLELALEGTILRGGVAIGLHHQSDAIVVGPALIEAHLLEANEAIVPRVLLSEDAIKLVAAGLSEWRRPAESPWVSHVVVDEDGKPFVSYLAASEEYDAGPADQVLVLEQHRARIVEGMAATEVASRPREKWEWLADYHDYYVAACGLHERLLTQSDHAPRWQFTSLADLLPEL